MSQEVLANQTKQRSLGEAAELRFWWVTNAELGSVLSRAAGKMRPIAFVAHVEGRASNQTLRLSQRCSGG